MNDHPTASAPTPKRVTQPLQQSHNQHGSGTASTSSHGETVKDTTTQMMRTLEQIQESQIKLTSRMDKLENPNPENSQTRESGRRANQDKDRGSRNNSSNLPANFHSFHSSMAFKRSLKYKYVEDYISII